MNDDHGMIADDERPQLEQRVEVLNCETDRCQRRLKTGRQCKKAATRGRRFCKRHGGNTIQIGPANPNWKHGRFSKHLPMPLRSSLPVALTDIPGIEVIDGLIESACRALSEGGGVGTGAALRETFERLMAAMSASDSDEIRASLMSLRELAHGATATDKHVRELRSLISQRSQLVDRERRIRLDARNVLTREQAVAHANALISAVVRHVTDRPTLNAILQDIRALIADSTD